MTELEITIRDGVQTIRFTRPEKKNALLCTMYAAMNEALAAGDALEEVAAHLFVGSGGIFSAGSDINEFLARAQGGAALGGPVLQFIRALLAVHREQPHVEPRRDIARVAARSIGLFVRARQLPRTQRGSQPTQRLLVIQRDHPTPLARSELCRSSGEGCSRR